MNCHLAHGKSNARKRFDEIRTIYHSFVGEAHQEKAASAHDIKVLFGDLNFRIGLETENTCFLARQKNFQELLKHDQLWSQYHQYNFLPALDEAPVTFQPTYKFARGTCFYDLDSRPPAWCDRILWGTSDQVKCVAYNSVENVSFSDHKPIYGVYLLNIRRISKGEHLPTPIAEYIAPVEEKKADLNPEVQLEVSPASKKPAHKATESFDMIGFYGIS